MPKHVAIIMDGNARWAAKHSLPIKKGHLAGIKALENLVLSSLDLGIEYLTVYTFSTENWERPKEEVVHLINLIQNYVQNDVIKLIKKDIRIITYGSLSKLNNSLREKIKYIQNITKDNKSLTLNIAFDYGARTEILDSFKKILHKIKNTELELDDLSENLIRQNLYDSNLIPDPDLLIRTAGEMRLSNFLLWQIAYTELYFTKKLWPDFNKEDLVEAVLEFKKRTRKFGKR